MLPRCYSAPVAPNPFTVCLLLGANPAYAGARLALRGSELETKIRGEAPSNSRAFPGDLHTVHFLRLSQPQLNRVSY
jgi:hypothetical protein